MQGWKRLLTRLSDRFFASVPDKVREKVEAYAPTAVLRLVSHNPHPVAPADPTLRRLTHAASHEAVDEAIRLSQRWILDRQHPVEGFWVAELEADTTLTSEYLMLRRFLNVVDPERERKAVRYLTATQLPDGGWPIYAGGPSEISASVKAYFALKLSGV